MTHKLQHKLKLLILILFFTPLSVVAQNRDTVSNNITQNTTWQSDTKYILDGVIFVTNGAELTIEAGTKIYAEDGQDLNASALVVSSDGKIYANGTAKNPIVFTSVRAMNQNLDKNDTGLWGGVVILGESTTNNPSAKAVEGINEIVSQQNLEMAKYGGNKPADNSGVFTYVSIRHTGVNVGSSSGNEIQGLSLGAVGSGTTIHHVESFASADDGFEFFGGTVNTRYMVSAFVEDDGFDTDEGYRGKNQFWFVIQDTDAAGHMAEQDGSATDAEDTKPFAYPQIANATYIGTGNYSDVGSAPSGDQAESILLRDNTGVRYINSVFASDFKSPFLVVENTSSSKFDSRARLKADSIKFKNSVFATSLLNGTLSALTNNNLGNAAYTNNMLTASANNNTVADAQFKGITRTADGTLDPRSESNVVWSGTAQLSGDFWTQTDYKGAFGNENWLIGWTALSAYGFTASTGTPIADESAGQSLPTDVALKQNYPNPFNPTTNISYALPSAQKIQLTVYNMLGQKVATLVNGSQTAGRHTVTFNASNLSSGMYIYRLSGKDFTLMRKMTLIK